VRVTILVVGSSTGLHAQMVLEAVNESTRIINVPLRDAEIPGLVDVLTRDALGYASLVRFDPAAVAAALSEPPIAPPRRGPARPSRPPIEWRRRR
jgi:hypothetical protein